MIRVVPPEKPPGFDGEVRDKGVEWLNHPSYGKTRRHLDRPESYWTTWKECARALAEGFHHRCGYTASYTPLHDGHVDHFVSWNECQHTNRHELVYEWDNLRWLHWRINQRKSKLDRIRCSNLLLDPFEVQNDWFELDLGLGVLRITDAVPPEKLDKARYTLEALDLYDGRIVEEQRRDAVEDFCAGASLERIEAKNPLVARAIRRLLDAADDELTPANLSIKRDLLDHRTRALLQQS